MPFHNCKVCKNSASYQLSYFKTGNKKPVISFATLLQNKLNSDVTRFITNLRTCPAANEVERFFCEGGKTSKIAIQLVLKLSHKTSCTFFVGPFTVPQVKIYTVYFSHRTPVNFLLMNLAIADMTVAMFFAPRYLFIHSITHPDGAAGLLLCKLLTSGNLAWVGAASSVVILVSIAFERYYAVLHPHEAKGKLTTNKAKVNSHPCSFNFIIKMMSFEKASTITVVKNRGGTQQIFIGEAPPRRPSHPLPFYIPF